MFWPLATHAPHSDGEVIYADFIRWALSVKKTELSCIPHSARSPVCTNDPIALRTSVLSQADRGNEFKAR